MKNKGILLAAFVFLLSAFASAGTVSFTTSGTFSSSGTNVSSGGITFSGTIACAAGCSAPNQVSLGTFTGTGSINNTTSDTFTLTITQTSPSGSGTLVATITGHVTLKKSNAHVHFGSSNQEITLAGVTYTILTPDFTINWHDGADIAAQINIPEPSASLLLGLASLGLLGLATGSRKRIVNA